MRKESVLLANLLFYTPGYIAPDGTCYNNCNDVIGYINEAAGEAGSVYVHSHSFSFQMKIYASTNTLFFVFIQHSDCEFLGLIRSDYVIENNLSQKCGTLDPGRAFVSSFVSLIETRKLML